MAITFFHRSTRPPAYLHLPHALLLLLAFCALGFADSSDDDNDKDDDKSPTVTKAPVFLPHYDQDDWDLVRGSVVSSNASASETTYTIFCPAETPPACDLSLEFPFVIVEGPHTVQFHGTVTSAFTADLGCDLNGTIAATCSGYSSYRSDYSDGMHTGPTELTWTTTYRGSEVQWGTLTMAEPPPKTSDPLGLTMTTGAPSFASSGDLYYMPSPTDEGAGATVRVDKRWAIAATIGGIIGFVL